MLLAAEADGLDLGGGGFGLAERLTDRAGGRIAPGVGMLFFGAGGEVGNQIIGLRGGGEHFAIARVHDEDLGGLGAAINADQQCSHT